MLFLTFSSKAAHIIGGEISYECLGSNGLGNQYEIKLTMYRDAYSLGAGFDAYAPIAIYGGQGLDSLIQNLNVQRSLQVNTIKPAPNPCWIVPPNVAIQQATYVTNITLPISNYGYEIVYQRCCRVNTITNVPNSGNWGSTYNTSIPPLDSNCNSSPAFSIIPDIVLCKLDSLELDFSALDIDGDSIYYFLCAPKSGGSQNNPAPNPPSHPPFIDVTIDSSLSWINPIHASPQLNIDHSLGLLTGSPTAVGQYLLGICASEYDSTGILKSIVRRDFQFQVVNCTNCNQIATQPTNDTVGLGSGIALFHTRPMVAGGNFQWQENQGNGWVDLFNSIDYKGAYTDSLLIQVNLSMNGYKYRCVVSRANCIPDTTVASTLYVIDDLGSESFLDQGYLYPNPTTGVLHFDIKDEFSYQIIDNNGRLLKSGISTGYIPIDYPSGKYMVIIEFDTNLKKFRVNKI